MPPPPAEALSITGKPIKFIGIGEKLADLEPFYPERIATRILDGASLERALRRSFDEVVDYGGLLGVIAGLWMIFRPMAGLLSLTLLLAALAPAQGFNLSIAVDRMRQRHRW